jgi:phage shock protein PspC (stress-responsive transcriptional regulator)
MQQVRKVMIYEMRTRPKFVRSQNGILAGVLEGLANSFKIDATVLRLCWIGLILFFGTGVFLYLVLAFILPREDKLMDFEKPKVLGVCYRISENYGYELGIVRLMVFSSFFLSFGAAFLLYVGAFFLLPEGRAVKYYRVF